MLTLGCQHHNSVCRCCCRWAAACCQVCTPDWTPVCCLPLCARPAPACGSPTGLRPGQPGQHLLHERSPAVPHAHAAPGTAVPAGHRAQHQLSRQAAHGPDRSHAGAHQEGADRLQPCAPDVARQQPARHQPQVRAPCARHRRIASFCIVMQLRYAAVHQSVGESSVAHLLGCGSKKGVGASHLAHDWCG